MLRKLFGHIEFESIFINNNGGLTGTFLRPMRSTNLKSLGFNECHNLKVSNVLSAIDKLRNVTELQVDYGDTSFMKEVHLLLREMLQLEELSLREFRPEYGDALEPLKDETYESFAGLVNLKRLNMENTHYVNDTLLKALARGCKKLEVLDIRGCARMVTAEGLTALCRRSPSAVTTLHFGLPHYELDGITIEEFYQEHFCDVPLFRELARLGCVQMTRKWFKDTCLDECVRELTLNPRPKLEGARVETPQQTLKIAVFDDAFEYGWENFV